MENIPYILTEHSLTVVIDGKAQTMRNDHPSWEMAKGPKNMFNPTFTGHRFPA